MPRAFRTLHDSLDFWRRYRLIARSAIFDPAWYKGAYPEAEGCDPISHYLREGAEQGFRPHLLFDPVWRRAAVGAPPPRDPNPLIDYILLGAAEGVEPSPYFSTPYYRKISGGFGRLTPLGHFISHGAPRGLVPTPLFDRNWYLAHNPDVEQAGFDPFLHFVASGDKDARSPGPFFDSGWYRLKNPDARDAGMAPLHHYIAVGADEGRSPSPAFDVEFFLAECSDQGLSRRTALAFYAERGRAEWRSSHPVLPPPASPGAFFETLPWRWSGSGAPALEAPFRVVVIDVGAKTHGREKIEETLRLLAALADLDVHLVTDRGAKSLPDGAAFLDLTRPDFAGVDLQKILDRILRSLRFRDPHGLILERACATIPLAEKCADLKLLHHKLDEDGPSLVSDLAASVKAKIGYRQCVKPTISAIVPNFNHARHLDERLASIMGQRWAPDEIIFLDDASNDDSLAIAESWRAKSSIPFTIIASEENSGSPFIQWVKGIEGAAGELVWIAESDDSADPRFLEHLAPLFMDPETALAYCDSQVIGAEEDILAQSYRFYTDTLSETKWLTAYLARGVDEIAEALAIKNTIPNVSAALFRRAVLCDSIKGLENFRYCGDWRTYVACLRKGSIAFCPQALSRHRQMLQSMTRVGEQGIRAVDEAIAIKLSIFEEVECKPSIVWKSLAQTILEYELRSKSAAKSRPRFVANEELADSIAKLKNFLARRPHEYSCHSGDLAAYVRRLASESLILKQTERENFVALVLDQVQALQG